METKITESERKCVITFILVKSFSYMENVAVRKFNVFDNISMNECTQRDDCTLSSPNSNSCNTSSDSGNTSTSPVVFLSKLVNTLRNPNKRTPQRESYSNIMKQNCPANNELQPTQVKKA